MKREHAFRAFLRNNNKPEAYIGYCKTIEQAFGGKDMDKIIASHQNISKVRAKLSAITTSKKSIDNYMAGLNRYLEFSVSARTLSSSSIVVSQYHVARAEGVALTEDVVRVARVLEQEYAKIVEFAKILLIQGDFKYIPIIISDEMPYQDGPEAEEPILGAFFPSSKPHIEIYYRHADSHNAAAFRKCLAHEYLHYLHYVYAGTAFSKADRKLKEALADFFGVLYSIYRHQKSDLAVAKARYQLWKKRFGGWWPYACALHFYRISGVEMKYSSDYTQYVSYGCVGKFVQIFFDTKNPDRAYDTLIH